MHDGPHPHCEISRKKILRFARIREIRKNLVTRKFPDIRYFISSLWSYPGHVMILFSILDGLGTQLDGLGTQWCSPVNNGAAPYNAKLSTGRVDNLWLFPIMTEWLNAHTASWVWLRTLSVTTSCSGKCKVSVMVVCHHLFWITEAKFEVFCLYPVCVHNLTCSCR